MVMYFMERRPLFNNPKQRARALPVVLAGVEQEKVGRVRLVNAYYIIQNIIIRHFSPGACFFISGTGSLFLTRVGHVRVWVWVLCRYL
jgi:hypothetical protein